MLRLVLPEAARAEENAHVRRLASLAPKHAGRALHAHGGRAQQAVEVGDGRREAAGAHDLLSPRRRLLKLDAAAPLEFEPGALEHHAAQAPHDAARHPHEVEHRPHAEGLELGGRPASHAPDLRDGRHRKGLLPARGRKVVPVEDAPEDGMNLGPVVAELGERLRGRNARTGRNPRPLEHASPRLAAERRKILHARDVRKLLVDRIDLLPRHERADHRHHAVRHRLIELVVAREHRDAVPLGELPDLKVRDAPRNAERLRLGRPRHDAAVVVREDHHGAAPERGIEHPVHRGIEGVAVNVKKARRHAGLLPSTGARPRGRARECGRAPSRRQPP